MPLHPSKRSIDSSYETSAVKFVKHSLLVTVTGRINSVSESTAASATSTATTAGTSGFASEISIVADFGNSSVTA